MQFRLLTFLATFGQILIACQIIFPVKISYSQNITGGGNVSNYLNSPLIQYENAAMGFKIMYPSNCEKVEFSAFVGFCGWETGIRVGKLGNYNSLDDLTNAVALPNEQIGARVTINPVTIDQGSAANMIEIIYNTTGGRIGVVTLRNGDAYMIGTDFGPGGRQVAELLLERVLDTFEITK